MPDRHQVAAILDNSRDELAEAITDRHYELHPELAESFGPAGRSHCREDAQYHLSYLSAAIAAGTPAEVRVNPLVVEVYLGGSVAAIERSGGARQMASSQRRSAS